MEHRAPILKAETACSHLKTWSTHIQAIVASFEMRRVGRRFPFASSWAMASLLTAMPSLKRAPDAFVHIVHALGVPLPDLMAWLTILVELFGGLAVLLGAFIPLVSLPMAVVLLVAVFSVHLPYGFTSIKLMAVTAAGPQFGPPGYETDLLYLACLVALVVGGPGPWAVDRLIATRWGRP